MSQKRRILFSFILIGGIIIFGEVGSFLMLKFLERRPIGAAIFIVRRPEATNLAKKLMQQLQDPLFDPKLGWSRRKASKTSTGGITYTFLDDGSRFCGKTDGPVIASFYGCSGTMGLEVSDLDSFPAYVSELTGIRVKNWGVPGYGVDQTLLLFERKLKEEKEHPPVVFLGMGTEGINRNVSAWRLFYTGENLLKPRLLMTEHGLKPFNPILANPSNYIHASDNEILKALVPYDYWLSSRFAGNIIVKPSVEFPFTASLGKSAMYLLGKSRSELAFPKKKFQSPFNLYDQKEPLLLLEQITDRFFDICREHQLKGYLVLISGEFYVDATEGRIKSNTLHLKKGNGRRLDENYLSYLNLKGYPYIDTLPIFSKVMKGEGSLKSMFCPYQHPSPRANKLIAEAIIQKAAFKSVSSK